MERTPDEKSGVKQWDTTKLWTVAWILLLLYLVSLFVSGLYTESPLDNIAVIPIHGVISTQSSGSLFERSGLSSTEIIDLLDRAEKSPNIKAVILEINSPGGSGVASWEIALKLRQMNKTKVAVIRESGASGAYWIASAADKIYVSPFSLVGSIGVQASYLEFAGLMEKYGVKYRQLTGGQYKDIGSPFRELTPDEESILKKEIQQLHDMFIKEVAQNRKLDEAYVRKVADGRFFTGTEAITLKLADEAGTKDDAIKYIEQMHSIKAQPVEYSASRGFFQRLSGVLHEQSFEIGRGIGFELMQGSTDSLRITT